MTAQSLLAGITPSGEGQDGVAWNVLGIATATTATFRPACFPGLAPPCRLKAPFDRLHDLTDIAEAIPISAEHDVGFVS